MFQCGPLPAFLPTGTRGRSWVEYIQVSMRAPARLPSDKISTDPFRYGLAVSMRAPARLPSDPKLLAGGEADVSMRAPARLPSDGWELVDSAFTAAFQCGPLPAFLPTIDTGTPSQFPLQFQCGPLPAFLPTRHPRCSSERSLGVSMRAPARLPSDAAGEGFLPYAGISRGFNAGPCPPSFRRGTMHYRYKKKRFQCGPLPAFLPT